MACASWNERRITMVTSASTLPEFDQYAPAYTVCTGPAPFPPQEMAFAARHAEKRGHGRGDAKMA
jgi:hypothetical protein